MTPRETEPQKETIERVMHEYKHGELGSGTSGQKVKNRKQAVAIALSEAGASNQQTPKENEEHLRHTKAKERRGETAKDETEGKRPCRRPSARERPRGSPAVLGRRLGRDLLRLRRSNHLGARRNHDVRTRLGQVGTLLGLRLFPWSWRTDHIGLRNGNWLFRLWLGRHRTQTQGGRYSFRLGRL